jgi:hypothetical protein
MYQKKSDKEGEMKTLYFFGMVDRLARTGVIEVSKGRSEDE